MVGVQETSVYISWELPFYLCFHCGFSLLFRFGGKMAVIRTDGSVYRFSVFLSWTRKEVREAQQNSRERERERALVRMVLTFGTAQVLGRSTTKCKLDVCNHDRPSNMKEPDIAKELFFGDYGIISRRN